MSDHSWIEEAAKKYPRPPVGPDTTETLLADPHLLAVFQIARSVTEQVEGMCDISAGLASAVSGKPASDGEDYSNKYTPGSRERWFMGYYLGCQMVWEVASGIEDGAPMPELPGIPDPGETVQEWVTRWRSFLAA